jgi:hypothetical protein
MKESEMADTQTKPASEDILGTDKLEKVDLSDDYIFDQALEILAEAKKRDLLVRLIGSTAFVVHCPENRSLFKALDRRLTDVDLMSYSSASQSAFDDMFAALGYEPIRSLGWHAAARDIYVNDDKLYVDVFKDTLSYCHVIDFKDRLELDEPTITLVDLMLEKLQVVEINEKDFKDMAVLLLEHELGSDDPEKIDSAYLARLWSKDWGFYYTGTTNLKKLNQYLKGIEALETTQKNRIKDQINRILNQVETEPKSVRWKLRSKIGTKMRWYEEVEGVVR